MTRKWSPKSWSRRARWIVAFVVVVSVMISARPVWHLWRAVQRDHGALREIPSGFADDASRLNLTKINRVWDIPQDTEQAERQLAELLVLARRERLPVSIAGARHSMGGHTICPDGVVINMRPFRRMRLNDAKDRLHVQAGALWEEIIPFLDEQGRSVAVMQSNNSFSVGGSISVNCHGWQFDRPPIASTVESFRLMKADGNIVTCRRSENADLFSLALGGYGLFGVILDVELRVVPNARYRMEQFLVSADDALPTYDHQVRDRPDVEMVYARMSIVPNPLFREVLLTAFIREEGDIPKLHDPDHAKLHRAIFVARPRATTARNCAGPLKPNCNRGSPRSRSRAINCSMKRSQSCKIDPPLRPTFCTSTFCRDPASSGLWTRCVPSFQSIAATC